MVSKEPELVVIDTDGGGDDAMAILLALSDKKAARLLAITCCFGNTALDNVCPNVMRILTICNEKEIPVHRGCNGALVKNYRKNLVFGTDGFGNVAHEFPIGGMKESNVPAPLALIQLAKKHLKEINLVAIGPLTNLAIAHRIDPEFTKNLKSIVVMGGNYKGIGNATEVAEFNFYCDPESAHTIISEASCPLILVPWEPVLEFGIDWHMYDKLIDVQTFKARFIKRINEYHVENSKKKGNKRYYDGDFLAVAALMDPTSIASSIERAAVVECGGTYSRGLTILLRDTSEGVATKK